MKLIAHECHFEPPEPHHARFYLVENKPSEVIGSCQLHDWNTDTPSFCWLWVQPEYRRRGVGAALLNRAIQDCVEGGKNSLHLSVQKTNEAALALYRSLGFTHYQQTETNLYMVKLLKGAAC